MLQIPREKWSLPAIRPPKPRAFSPGEKAALVPPDWIVVYTPATGEIRYEPPPAGADLRLRPASNSTPSSTGLLGRVPSLLNIIGTDERSRISPTTDFPWRVVGKAYIRFPNDSSWGGSGALIDPFHVLTAGHVVHDTAEGGWATEIEFVPGMDGNSAPFSSAWDVNVRAPAGWVDSQDQDYDWGLITLDRSVGTWIGWFGYTYEALDYYPQKTFNLAGYPAELDQGLGLYWAANVATRATDNVLYHVIDSTGGQSGGPIWRYVEATDESHVMAVHTYGGATENSGTRINASRFDNLNTWRSQDTPPTDYAELIDDGMNYAGFNPPSVSSGAHFEVHADVRNVGTAIAANFDVTFYASVDTTISAQDYPIGAVHVAHLQPFSYVTCTWTGSFPGSIPLGNYYVGWVIDSGSSVTEISETNNTAYLPTQLIVGTPPNLRFAWGDFNPAAPIQITPSDPVTLTAHIQNTGQSTAGTFWLEFWGSRTGGLTKSLFLATSARPGPIAPNTTLPFSTATPLSSVPDGPYTVVMLADRPNEIAETNELDNRVVIGGKRLLVIRPQTDADLRVSGFSFGPNPAYSGDPLALGGIVQNVGSQDSGSFWIEFFGSYTPYYPNADFFLCDSIHVSNLAPGQAIDLSVYPRTLYSTPSGTFMVGVMADRLDQVSERDETNNYLFLDNYRLNTAALPTDLAKASPAVLPNLRVVSADFEPHSPFQAPPGTPLTIWTRVSNESETTAGPFWVEFWGSRTGGMTLDELLADSIYVNGLAPFGAIDINISRSLYSISDGPYTLMVVVDRPAMVSEGNERDNRLAVAGKRLLTIRPQTQANLVLLDVAVGPNQLRRGLSITLSGKVLNVGAQNSGAFWIEFLGARTPDDPELDFFLCDSILVNDLPPGGFVDLSGYTRTLYASTPVGSMAVVCFADRTDLVNETHEEDNYVILNGYSVSP
jgi:V8-like Glu-specific endopeptidase